LDGRQSAWGAATESRGRGGGGVSDSRSFASLPWSPPAVTRAAAGPGVWQTAEGTDIQPVYHASALDPVLHLESMPGFAPFVRGPYSTMYVRPPWTLRQYAGFSPAEESSAFYRRTLAPRRRVR